MSGDGTFGYQGTYGTVAEQGASSLRAIGLRTTALVAMSPGGIRQAIYNATLAKQFIAAAVAKAAETGMDG
jgi:hypothetical protein